MCRDDPRTSWHSPHDHPGMATSEPSLQGADPRWAAHALPHSLFTFQQTLP